MGFGQVNVATDTSVDLKFRFVNAATKDPIVSWVYSRIVVVTDGGVADSPLECVTMWMLMRGAWGGTFTAMISGGTIDNPLGPMGWNMLQERRSMGVVFENPEFSMAVSEPNSQILKVATWSSLKPLGALLDGQPVRSRTWGCRLVLDYSFSDWSNTAVVL